MGVDFLDGFDQREGDGAGFEQRGEGEAVGSRRGELGVLHLEDIDGDCLVWVFF